MDAQTQANIGPVLPSDRVDGSGRAKLRSDRWIVLLLVVVTLAALGRVCFNDFIQGDDEQVVALTPLQNPPTWSSLRAWWSGPVYERYYTPLSHTLFGAVALVARVPPDAKTGYTLSPVPFHALNLALHVLAAIVVFKILRLLVDRPWPAAAGALLFAIHPVQVEAVAWVAAMNAVLSGTLSLVATWQYLLAVTPGDEECPRRRATLHYVAATVAFALALLSKPSAVVVPLIMAVLDWLVVRRPLRRVAASLWPWVLMAAACALWTQHLQPHRFTVVQPWWFRPLVAADAIAFYVYKLVFPLWLGVYYGRTPAYIETRDWAYYTWLVPFAVLMLVIKYRPPRPMIAGLLVFVVALLPVLGLVDFDFQAISTVADRYLYLPMLGIALFAASALAQPWCSERPRRGRVALACATVLLVLGAMAYVQAGYWRDTETLFDHARRVRPVGPKQTPWTPAHAGPVPLESRPA